LNQESSRIAKSIFYAVETEEGEPSKMLVAVVPGNLEANEAKLRKYVKAAIAPASEEEIRKFGIVPGFGSPVGLAKQENLIVIVDDLIAKVNNYVMGANKEDYHLTNVCCNRDYTPDVIGDIVNAYEGAIAPNSESGTDTLVEKRGIEVGNIFQLGTKYTKAMGATFMDMNGKPQDIIMGSYGIGVGRAFGCVAEQYNDDKGLVLPYSALSFYRVTGSVVTDKASPGVKFTDADLIGIPIQIVISDKNLVDDLVEIRTRDGKVSEKIKVSEDKNEIISFLKDLVERVKS